jgi:ubiquinol-cytochrome c reductase cytochrome b subunit
MLLPALLIGGVLTHLAILWRQKHTQFGVPGATERSVVGRPFWPTQVFKSTGLMLLTAAVLALMGGLIQINPVWSYGPFDATTVSAPAQPDWYVGSLRLFPPIEFTLLGITIPSVFIPGVVIPGIAFGIMTLWPFIEARITGDRDEHHVLDRPYDNAMRASVGVAGLLAFVVLTIAGGNDVVALIFNVPVEVMTDILRVAFFALPLLGFFVTWRISHELQRRTDVPDARQPVVVRRAASGGFEEAGDER